jgi:integrase
MNTIAECIDAYLAFMRMRVETGSLVASTIDHALRYLELFKQQFGKLTIAEAKRNNLTEFLIAHPEWKSGWTRQDALRCVCSAFNWCWSEDLISTTPYRKSRFLRFNARPRQPMSVADYVAVMRAAMHRPGPQNRRGQERYDHRCGPRRPSARALRRALYFLRRTGARTCELRAVRWRDVDWEAKVIRLQHHKTERTGEDRIIGLDARLMRFLRNLHRQYLNRGEQSGHRSGRKRSDDDHIFLNGRRGGQPLRCAGFASMFRKFARIAGVPKGISPYGLRHLFCVTGIENDVSTRAIADQLGHSTTRYVDYYGRSTRFKTGHLSRVAESVLQRPRKGGVA